MSKKNQPGCRCCGNRLCCPTCIGDQIPNTWSFTYDGTTYNLRLREWDHARPTGDNEFRCEWRQSFAETTVAGCTVDTVFLETINRGDGSGWRLAFYHSSAPDVYSPQWIKIVGPPNLGQYNAVPLDCSTSVTLTEVSNSCGSTPAAVTITPIGFTTIGANCFQSVSCQVCCADGTMPAQMLLEIPPGAFANWGASPYCQQCSSINGSFVLDHVASGDPFAGCTWRRAIGPYCGYERVEVTPYPLGNGECRMAVAFKKAGLGTLLVMSDPIASYDAENHRILNCRSLSDLPINNLYLIGECNFIGPLYLSAL